MARLGTGIAAGLMLGPCARGCGSTAGSSSERQPSLFSASPSDMFGTNRRKRPPAAPRRPRPVVDDRFRLPGGQVRIGAETLMVGNEAGRDRTAALDLRYQVSIIRTARECHLAGNVMTMKVGIEGRIIIGPAGGPGEVDVPLRIAVVQEGSKSEDDRVQIRAISGDDQQDRDRVPFTQIEPTSRSRCRRRSPTSSHTSSMSASIRSAQPKKLRGKRPRIKRPAPPRSSSAESAQAGQLRRAARGGELRGYQPRRATIVLLSARMSAITAARAGRAQVLGRAGAARGCRRQSRSGHAGGAPAATPTANPPPRCSRPADAHLGGDVQEQVGRRLAVRNIAGREQVGIEEAQQAGAFEAQPDAIKRREEATHFGPRSQVSAYAACCGRPQFGAEPAQRRAGDGRRQSPDGSLRLAAASMSANMSDGRRPAK